MKNTVDTVITSESWMYLIESKALGYELAEDWMFFWTFFIPTTLILSTISKTNPLFYKGVLYIILVFVMTLIRRNIKSSFKYLIANIFIIFLVFIISFTSIEKIVFGGLALLCFAISINKRSNEKVEFYRIGILIWMEAVMLICYFIAFNYKLTFQIKLINFASINIAITCALYLFISRMSRLYEWEGNFIKEYSDRMRKIRLTCIGFICGIIIFLLLFAWKIGLYNLLDILTKKILDIFNSTDDYQIKTIKNPPRINKAAPTLNGGFKNFKSNGKSNHIVTIILNIAQCILFGVIFIALIYALYHLFIIIRNFYRGLRLKKKYKREKSEFVFILEDVKKEVKERTDKLKVALQLPFNLSNMKKIRRLYYKLIDLYYSKGLSVNNFNTPTEIEEKVREILNKDINVATQIYEKARYSKNECTKEDVENMKRLISKWR